MAVWTASSSPSQPGTCRCRRGSACGPTRHRPDRPWRGCRRKRWPRASDRGLVRCTGSRPPTPTAGRRRAPPRRAPGGRRRRRACRPSACPAGLGQPGPTRTSPAGRVRRRHRAASFRRPGPTRFSGSDRPGLRRQRLKRPWKEDRWQPAPPRRWRSRGRPRAGATARRQRAEDRTSSVVHGPYCRQGQPTNCAVQRTALRTSRRRVDELWLTAPFYDSEAAVQGGCVSRRTMTTTLPRGRPASASDNGTWSRPRRFSQARHRRRFHPQLRPPAQ